MVLGAVFTTHFCCNGNFFLDIRNTFKFNVWPEQNARLTGSISGSVNKYSGLFRLSINYVHFYFYHRKMVKQRSESLLLFLGRQSSKNAKKAKVQICQQLLKIFDVKTFSENQKLLMMI